MQHTGAAADLTRGPLVGRARELGELEAALEQALLGHGRVVFLAGESGIGKTRLAETIAERAQSEGARAVWGRCWEGGPRNAFWPWVHALRRLVSERSDAQLEKELGGGAAWVAQIVPDLRDRLGAFEPPGSLDSEQARFELFDAVTSFLRNASRSDPLLIVLDDIHAADHASLLLLEFVARAINDDRILVLATYQEAPAHQRPELERLIGILGRESTPIVLRGLSEGELARLISHRTTHAASDELVHALSATTEGNPFFADEVLRLLAAEGELELWAAGGMRARFPLPDTVKETIRRRFEALGERSIEVLECASVIGREFRLTTLQQASGTGAEELIDLIDAAATAGLIVEVRGAIGTLRFSHGMIRDTLYSGLSTARRVRLHRTVATALEEVYGDVPDRLAELAHHFAEAAPAGDPAKALDYALRAGQHATQMLAYEHAAELFELALTTTELLEPSPERVAEVLLALGEARARIYDSEARATLIKAAEAARRVDRVDLLARAALGVRAFALGAGVADEALLPLFDEALAGIDPGDSPLRARLLARLTVALYYLPGTRERREELAEEAVAMARQLADQATLAYVLTNAQLGTWGPDTTERCLAWNEELLELTKVLGDVELALVTHHRQIDFLLELDDVAGADIAVEELARLASDSPDPRALAYLALHRARRALVEGNYAEAERLNADASTEGLRVGDATIAVLVGSQKFGLRWSQGRHAELEQPIRRYAASAPGMPAWRAGLTLVYCQLGRAEQARRELERLARDGFAEIPRDNDFLLNISLLAEACNQLDDGERAAALYELLEPFDGRNAVAPHAFVAGPVSRYLGLLAATRGEADVARRHFAAAAAAAEALNARPLMAQVALDEAQLLARGGPAPDDEQLRKVLGKAKEIATELEAEGMSARVREFEASLGDTEPTERAEPKDTEPTSADLKREGDVWTFGWEGRVVRVRDSKGVQYLAVLLANPDVEIHATQLAGGPGDRPAQAVPAAGELEGAGGDDAGPVLDATAKAAYRTRLQELQEELEEAESFNDPERSARARQELDLITAELAGAVGLGGRDRKLGSTAERARVNVTRAIRSVLKRIGEHDSELGRELSATIKTGTFCAYEPDPRRPIAWRVADD